MKITYDGVDFNFILHSYLHNQKKFDFPMVDDDRTTRLSFDFIPFTNLKITQKQLDSFKPSHLVEILKNFHPALLRPSSVIKYKNEFIIWDGHHSATIALCIGLDAAPCMVYECYSIDEINEILDSETVENVDIEQILNMIEHIPELKHEVVDRYGK